jgi:murein DD-endopeptidase MepM/ murein hydrolase activator NlpD
MKFHMKWTLHLLIIVFIITSCAPAPIPILPTATIVLPQASATSLTLTATEIPESTPRATAPSITSIPCDPQLEAFCITDGHFIFQRPIKAPANDSVDQTYPYGSTARSTREPHHGVEFLNRFGTSVHAAASGVVVFAGADKETVYSPWANFYGNVIVIKHDDNLFTLYAHLSEINVQAGKDVQVGEKVGEVGQSGVATGSHLHFEVRRGNAEDYFSTENPELWLVPNKDENGHAFGALMISVVDEDAHLLFSEITVQYYLDRSQPNVKAYYIETYSNDMALGRENASLGDLPHGSYRITFTMNGQLYERWVEVESGKLTEVVFAIK